MFLTDFGKSLYLKEALLDNISILKVGTVVSVKSPFTFPFTSNFPVVSTPSKLPAYAAGIKPKKFLKSEDGVLKDRSYTCPFSTI